MKRRYKTSEYKMYPNDVFYVDTLPNIRLMFSDVADFLDRYLRSYPRESFIHGLGGGKKIGVREIGKAIG